MVGAGGILPPDVVVRAAPVIAAVSIVAIGGWMLFGEGRRPLARPVRGARLTSTPTTMATSTTTSTRQTTSTRRTQAAVGEHSHGGVAHTHLPPAGTTISWRSLFVLGLAGGLIPSTSALLILLGSIAAGRPAFGFVLVVAFGLGMALVMGGIGLALVLARGRLDRVDAGSPLGRVSGVVPLAAAPRLRSRAVPDHPGGRRPGHVLTRVGAARPAATHPPTPHRTGTRANAQHVIRSSLC